MIKDSSTGGFNESNDDVSTKPFFFPNWLKTETAATIVLLALAVLTWAPRLNGPIDLRWDAGVYYILGTSLAEGKGYKLLNEPGEIDAVQYPPLLPAIVAAYQLALGTSDPTTVGRWLRFSAFIIFILYIYVVFRFLRTRLALYNAFLAAILCLFSWQVYFLSDLLFPEILFSHATLLFILCAEKEKSRTRSVLAYLFAVASFALRTVGIVAFAAWVLESLFKRRFKQAALRAFLALIPILGWQLYIASVESSDAYNHPAYAYQRAPYMFYNVSYTRNVSLKEPFTPEAGDATPLFLAQRFVGNALLIPASLGETLSAPRGYWEAWLKLSTGDSAVKQQIVSWSVFLILYAIGFFVLGGFAVQLLRRQWLVPLYGLVYTAALCLTPFPGQYLRYLMPIVPLLALSLFVFLLAARDTSRRFLGLRRTNLGAYLTVAALSTALLAEILCLFVVYRQELQQISYFDRSQRQIKQRLFYYDEAQQGFDESVDYVRRYAQPDELIAAGTPHLIYLRTGLKAVMPPFETDVAKAQLLLDSVPVSYLIVGRDVVGAERYTLPVVQQFTDQWKQVFSASDGAWIVYQRVNR